MFLCKKECKITKNSVKTTFLNRIFSAKKLIFSEKYELNVVFSHISYLLSHITAIFAKKAEVVIKNYPLYSHEYFMSKALDLAVQAGEAGEIPVGAIVVAGGSRIIGKGSNQTEQLNDVTAHAEIIAITAATQFLGAKYLKDCTLYVTLEPCVMCAGALHWSQIDRIIFGASDSKRGFARVSPPILHPKTSVVKGILETDCEMLLKNFFKALRT